MLRSLGRRGRAGRGLPKAGARRGERRTRCRAAAPPCFHDLRHTGNVLTASAGASLKELMARMGHASTRAALLYLHDTDDRQRAIAAAVSDLARQELEQPDTSPGSDEPEGTGT